MGDPRLLEPARPVERFDTPELHALIADLDDTMKALDGAGLAAPQIGVGLQVAIFGVEHNPRYPDAEPVPYTVLINPLLTPIGADMEEGWEGCLSVPGIRGRVPRAREITVRAFDRNGERLEIHAHDFPARVIQHETDHLDGILFFDRMRSLDSLTFLDEYSRYWTKD